VWRDVDFHVPSYEFSYRKGSKGKGKSHHALLVVPGLEQGCVPPAGVQWSRVFDLLYRLCGRVKRFRCHDLCGVFVVWNFTSSLFLPTLVCMVEVLSFLVEKGLLVVRGSWKSVWFTPSSGLVRLLGSKAKRLDVGWSVLASECSHNLAHLLWYRRIASLGVVWCGGC